MTFEFDFDFKKKMFGGGPIKVTTWYGSDEWPAYLIEYSDIPVTIFLAEEGSGIGLQLYLEKKRMQGERTIALEEQMIADFNGGVKLPTEYLTGRLRELIAKAIDPTCRSADELLHARWYEWHPGCEHPDGRDDSDENGERR
jgi:hypothetical protein